MNTYAVVGCGKLGLALAGLIKEGWNTVYCIDEDTEVLRGISMRSVRSSEPTVQASINDSVGLAYARKDCDEAVRESEIIFIVVPTPTRHKLDPRFDTSAVRAVCKKIGHALRDADGRRVISIVSTVMPGCTAECESIIAEASGKVPGEDFAVCYNPAFIALGSIVTNLRRPDMVLIGSDHGWASRKLCDFHHSLTVQSTRYHVMRPVEAEWTKLLVNSYITMKISFANMVGQIAEASGCDCDKITSAIGDDQRVGGKYLRSGAGFGGPCFPRDNQALVGALHDVGAPADIPKCTIAFNKHHEEWIRKLVKEHIRPGDVVGILGVSYKPGAPSVGPSTGKHLIEYLKKVHDGEVIAHDARLGPRPEGVRFTKLPEECVRESDVVVITIPSPAYSAIPPFVFKDVRTIIDIWRILKESESQAAKHIRIGG
jgi:UDPglucose 6-dehydrogenase